MWSLNVMTKQDIVLFSSGKWRDSTLEKSVKGKWWILHPLMPLIRLSGRWVLAMHEVTFSQCQGIGLMDCGLQKVTPEYLIIYSALELWNILQCLLFTWLGTEGVLQRVCFASLTLLIAKNTLTQKGFFVGKEARVVGWRPYGEFWLFIEITELITLNLLMKK